MKTTLPIIIAVLFLFAPAFPLVQGLAPERSDAPKIPFHTPAYTEGKILPRDIQGNTAVGPEDGVVLINTVVTVQQGATLTIQPGTRLAVAEYAGIRVLGTLNAQGTEKNPVRFISNELNQTNRNWVGILYEGTGSGTIEHAIFHHASPAITCAVPGNVTLNENTYLFGNLEVYGPC